MNSITMAIFGGVLNFNKMDWMARKTVRQLWRKFEEAEFEKKDRIYGTRDWDDPNWTKELTQKVCT